MDTNGGSSNPVKKQEEGDTNETKKPETKPVVRTLNRVPRTYSSFIFRTALLTGTRPLGACNACRKQKMRCEGAENPPCRRCRHAGLECLFEKPTREASLTGEAGLERIRSLEAHVAEIRQSQTVIQNTLAEIAAHLRAGSHFQARSPSAYPPFVHQSPSVHSIGSPSMSTPTVGSHPPQLMVDTHNQTPTPGGSSVTPMMGSHPQMSYQTPPMSAPGHRSMGSGDMRGSHPPTMYSPHQQGHPTGPNATTLPPFSTIDSMGRGPSNVSSMRYHPADQSQRQPPRANGPDTASGSKRAAPIPSTATSADSTDAEEDDSELPASGLVAPWEVLRGLADVAIERAAQENGGESTDSQSRPRTSSPEPRHQRPAKRRKFNHKPAGVLVIPDVVTKKIVSEADARELFRIFYHGCSTFLSVFDANVDTFDALHGRSPFAVDCICMVAAKVRDGGGNPSEIFSKCEEEVHSISCQTLFSPVVRQEAVQAMILVSGWSENGWLSGGHAVRMAMELSMHKAWPEVLRRMRSGKAGTTEKERQLVISARTWFCLYLFEHQMSYGTGRPAILKDDESIWQCRMLLQHPLAIEDDMRLVSTVELMAIRERIHNSLAPHFDKPVDERTFNVLREADVEFRNWFATWDHAFSQKYEDAGLYRHPELALRKLTLSGPAFYRQSLQIQHLTAELFHNATALRGIDGPEDVRNMPPAQRELAIRSIQIGRQILDITVNSQAYREGMKYAVHYTHATATFSASFLLRLSRLFPDQCNIEEIRILVERLAALLAEVPGKRYAITLQLMLKRFKKRKSSGMSHSPQVPRPGHRGSMDQSPHSVDVQMGQPILQHAHQPTSPTYDPNFVAHPEAMAHMIPGGMAPQQQQFAAQNANIDHILHGFESTSTDQLPVWLSDQSLGGQTFSQYGIDAFLLPNDYLPPGTQIW
ncbi:hypothetical protein NM688_g2024 [Phlebia brevispora]|uniref:Uncharacterized protein n=1 Tax=Phlebia brevispora TaxID=194682 RepID=A0ACC1TAF8_9APHY|nr:hypothetical protein NM688_g2024 [Phlebia brevispora]